MTNLEAAIKAWQDAHPQRLGELPDFGNLLEWLLTERDRLRAALNICVEVFADDEQSVPMSKRIYTRGKAAYAARAALEGK